MKITIAGSGYVGLVTAVCLAEIGHNVICTDIDENKIEMLNKGKSTIYENGLEELMKKNKNFLTFTTDVKKAYKNPDVIIISVGTPESKNGKANLEYVYKVSKEIAETIEKNTIIVIKSTVPIGTNRKVEKLIKKYLKNNVEIEVVSSPEFLSQGTAINDTINAQRIILGVNSKKAENIMKQVYKGFNQSFVITNPESAEMIKYASNNFLALKISYINEIANLCEDVGANIDDVVKGIGMDKRIGKEFLNAGIGYGGSCFPKDTKSLYWISNFYDDEIKTIKATIEVNLNQKLKLIKKAKKYYKSFDGIKIAILGLTFKPNTDDLRGAPSLDNIQILLEEGAKIKVYDPVGEEKYKKIYPREITYCKTIIETLKDTQICFIFTEWNCIKNLDINIFEEQMQTPIILDGRNCYKIEEVKKHKVIYESIGRKIIKNIEYK